MCITQNYVKGSNLNSLILIARSFTNARNFIARWLDFTLLTFYYFFAFLLLKSQPTCASIAVKSDGQCVPCRCRDKQNRALEAATVTLPYFTCLSMGKTQEIFDLHFLENQESSRQIIVLS